MHWKRLALAALTLGAAMAARAQYATPTRPALGGSIMAAPASRPAGEVAARWARVQVDDPVCAISYPPAAKRPDRPTQRVISLQVDAAGHATSREVLDKLPESQELAEVVSEAVSRCPIEPARSTRGNAIAGEAWVTWNWDPVSATATVVAGRPGLILKGPGCKPIYPAQALRAAATGVTRLRFTVDPNGRAIGSVILESSGATPAHKWLDEAARSLSECKFVPARDAYGNRTTGTVDVSADWKLE